MSRTTTSTYSFPRMNSDARLREAILYISAACETDPTYGATKLNKVLQKSDLRCFARHGIPLTGAEYQALAAGPVPKRLLPVRNKMLEDREIREETIPGGGRTQVRTIALRHANLALFAPEAIQIVDEVIKELWGKRAIDASVESHGRAWRIARRAGVSIPYEAAFLEDDTVASPDDRSRAEELARQYGWDR